MENTYNITGLTFSELLETRVALDLQIQAMERLLDTTSHMDSEVESKARDYWRQRVIKCRRVMELCDRSYPVEVNSGSTSDGKDSVSSVR